jgi:hypothetical protein
MKNYRKRVLKWFALKQPFNPLFFKSAALFCLTLAATMHMSAQAPGGVAGVALWLKSDAGITLGTGTNVAGWADQSANSNNASQATAGNQPSLNTGSSANAINYNPTISFGAAGTTQLQTINQVFVNGSTYNDVHWFGSIKNTNTTDFDWFFYQATGAATSNRVTASWNFGGSANSQYDMGNFTTNRINWAFTPNVPNNTPNRMG